MSEMQVDLTNCDREPIHIPGQIQSHGYLVVVDSSYTIRYHSENLPELFSNTQEGFLDKPLSFIESFFPHAHQADFITQLINLGKLNQTYEQVNPYQVTICGKSFNLIISVTVNDLYLLEFEPTATDKDIQKMIGHSVSEILSNKQLSSMLHSTAEQVKNIIGYDRIMIYRFADDGHGEVVAEARESHLESWMGLHYPASDIPKQARELYKTNLTRLIADVHAVPSRIVTYSNSNQPLDLTYSQLRAVSPIHIQYLKNMGVASSFSISLLYKNELWGLIACHNYTPRFIDFKARESSKLIGQILSSALEFRQDEENQKVSEVLQANVDKLAKYLQQSSSVEKALTTEDITLMDVVNANGVVLVYEKNIIKTGTTPSDAQLNRLLKWVNQNINEPLFYTSHFSAYYPEAAAYKQVASGVMISTISRELEEYVIWFKPEVIQTLKWAGNPEKPVEVNENGVQHLSPRNSFEVWRQTVTGKSERWTSEEIRSVIRLKEELMYAINLKASAIRQLNEKLRLAYEELDTFSFTISHDLKNPLTAIKSYAQVLTRDETIGLRGQKMLLNIVERADKMNHMINEVLDYSRIGRSDIQYQELDMREMIDEIIRELSHVYNTRNVHFDIGDTPEVKGDPVMLLQLFSNLIGNAVKYSQHINPSIVTINGKVVENDVTYTIEDNGIGIPVKDLPKIFELFNRMDNAKHIEGTGVGLAIAKRIVEKHTGKIWVESQLGKGSKFFVNFKDNLKKEAVQTIAETV